MTITADDISGRLKAITDYVHDCDRRVHRGEIMDLKGLDQNVIELCEAVAALPRPEALALEPRMKTLIDALDALAAAIKAQHEQYHNHNRGAG